MFSNVILLKDIDSNPFLEIKDLFQPELKEVDNLIASKLSSHVDLIGKMSSHLMLSLIHI